MKTILLLLVILFSASLYSMENKEPTTGLQFQLQQMLNNVDKVSTNNEQLKQEITHLERRSKKRGCRLSKRRFYSFFRSMCVAICLTSVVDQLFMQSPLDAGF